MKRITVLKVVLGTILGLMTSSLAWAGADGSGGADNMEALFTSASSVVARALDGKSKVKLSDKSKKIINEYKSRIISEFNGMNLIFDHISEEPFVQANRSKTWIQTTFNPLAPIEVRTRVMKKMIKKVTLEALVNYLGHEVGHHILGENENAAWDLAAAVSEYVRGVIAFPSFLNMSTDYVGLQKGCRDQAHIEADPFTGVIVISAQSTDNCVFDPAINQKIKSKYDSLVVTFECTKVGKQKDDEDNAKRVLCFTSDQSPTDEIYINTKAEVLFDGSVTVHYEFNAYYPYNPANNNGQSKFIGYYKFNQKFVSQASSSSSFDKVDSMQDGQ